MSNVNSMFTVRRQRQQRQKKPKQIGPFDEFENIRLIWGRIVCIIYIL